MTHGMAKQNWSIGDTVRVGFVARLTVIERVPTPGDYQPDIWVLQAPGERWYAFTPHRGLRLATDQDDARRW